MRASRSRALSPAPLPHNQRHDRHAHRDAVGNLRQDHRLRSVRDCGIDIETAVHRAGCMTIASGLATRAFPGEPVEIEVFLFAGNERAGMRSRCRRSMITTSTPARPHACRYRRALRVFSTAVAAGSWARYAHFGGAERVQAWISERATRECRMSPTIATLRFSIGPLWRRMVKQSSSAWVGCACRRRRRSRCAHARARARRSGARAGLAVAHHEQLGVHGLKLRTVSSRVSPLLSRRPRG